MFKHFILLGVLIFQCSLSNSQSNREFYDSITRIIDNDSIFGALRRSEQVALTRSAIEPARKLNENQDLVLFYANLIVLDRSLSMQDKWDYIGIVDSLIEITDSILPELIINFELQRGGMYGMTFQFDKELETYRKADSLAQAHNVTDAIPYIKNFISGYYAATYQDEKSLKVILDIHAFFQERELVDTNLFVTNLYNLAFSYDRLKYHDSTIYYLNKVLGFSTDYYNPITLNVLKAKAFNSKEEYDSAYRCLDIAENLLGENAFYSSDGYDLFSQKSSVSHNSGDRKQGMDDLIFAFAIADSIGRVDGVASAGRSLTQLYLQETNKEFFSYFVKARSASDSLFKRKSLGLERKYTTLFDVQEKDLKIDLLNTNNEIAQLQAENRKVWIWILAAICVILLSIGLIIFNRINSKRKLQLVENSETKLKLERDILEAEQKMLLSQMNPHFIFNSLNSIKSFIIDNKEKDATEYLSTFAKLTRLILESSRKETIYLEDEIKILNIYLGLEQKRFMNKFDYEISMDSEVEEDKEDIKIPPMLLQPLVENAIVHGVADIATQGNIKINFSMKDSNNLKVSVNDNGKGMDSSSTSEHGSLSRQITKERIASFNHNHDENIAFRIPETKNGTTIELDIPV